MNLLICYDDLMNTHLYWPISYYLPLWCHTALALSIKQLPSTGTSEGTDCFMHYKKLVWSPRNQIRDRKLENERILYTRKTTSTEVWIKI